VSETRLKDNVFHALQDFQEKMKGEGEKVGLTSDDDVAAWITASRREEDIHTGRSENP